MQFELIAELAPAAVFGVPEEGMTVLPAAPGTHVGPTFFRTLVKVGHGAMSRYRDDSDALVLETKLGEVSVALHDNYATLAVDAANHREAFAKMTGALERWLRHLGISRRMLFSYTPLVLFSDDRDDWPLPRWVEMARVTTYDLVGLKTDMLAAAEFEGLSDARLERALTYFEDARLLFERRGLLASPLGPQHVRLIAGAFLNLWKAVTAIIGDPSVDRDYQSRYRELGVDQTSFATRIEPLRKLRDDSDVAHYTLDAQGNTAIEQQVGAATEVAADVIARYRTLLRSRSQDSQDPGSGSSGSSS